MDSVLRTRIHIHACVCVRACGCSCTRTRKQPAKLVATQILYSEFKISCTNVALSISILENRVYEIIIFLQVIEMNNNRILIRFRRIYSRIFFVNRSEYFSNILYRLILSTVRTNRSSDSQVETSTITSDRRKFYTREFLNVHRSMRIYSLDRNQNG
jgi:hypothetical protein